MKITIKNGLMITMLLLGVSLSKAEVTPTTEGVYLFCDGAALNLGAAPAGSNYIIRYNAEITSTPTEVISLEGSTVAGEDLKTGYYYISTKGTAEGSCESDMEQIAVYKFKPITVDFIAPTSYCIEDVNGQTFTGSVSSDDPFNTFAYQWYTVVDGTETAIDQATNIDYQPSADIAPGVETTYRLKVGYLVGTVRYCSQIVDKNVTVTLKPEKPTITVDGQSTGDTW